MANEKILVVDDDTNICELLRLYLTKEGYQVTTANDGEEGLDKFNQVKPDMVLLDVMMPKMDGLEVCRRIRKLGNTPVMMLTAKGETCDLEKIRQDIEDRDYRDMHRETSPLKQADDAVLVDTSDMTIEQVIDRIVELIG